VKGTVEQEIDMYVSKGVDALFVEFPGDTYEYLTSKTPQTYEHQYPRDKKKSISQKGAKLILDYLRHV